ncbi:hypothetical protein [Xenococcus sp. PCC 7305]|uniref:hypothetical protein n=1 Tax=Xenococcus sp. PCC 7305 TaxID=102125 RepID=UPI0002F6BDE6|nr:hypothetical protein [Xenococcus sp. PCC 7305]
MLSNITSNSPKETALQPGQKVYLYGDRRYAGILIRPLERIQSLLFLLFQSLLD